MSHNGGAVEIRPLINGVIYALAVTWHFMTAMD